MKKSPGAVVGYALKQLTQKPATISYPKGELQINSGYRGKLSFDNSDCIGCTLCMRDCPTDAITITNVGTKEDKKFECDWYMGRCIFCAQCVDSCRKGCLKMTPDIELSTLDRNDLKVKL